jgi:hypothetical protein
VAVTTGKLDANGQAHRTEFFSGKGRFTPKAVDNGDALFAAGSSQSLIEQVNQAGRGSAVRDYPGAAGAPAPRVLLPRAP